MTQTSVAAVGVALGLRALGDGQASAAAHAPTTGARREQARVDAPAPWALIAPLAAGSSIGNGWRIESLSDVRMGAAVLTVRHVSGGQRDVHVCLRDGQATGVAATRHFDFVLMNSADGGAQTEEGLGVSLLGLARRAELQEAAVSRAGFLSHRQRLTQYGWDQIT